MSIVTIFSLRVCSCKIGEFSCPRYFDKFDDIVVEEEKHLLCEFEKKNNFTVGYVNPSDLAYNSFENILNFEFPPFFKGNYNKKFSLKLEKLIDGVFKITESNIGTKTLSKIELLKKHILSIDSLDLYSLPANSEARGGKRLIFFSDVIEDIINHLVVFIQM